jgi:predicted amidohydrolase
MARIACCQLAPVFGDVVGNSARAAAAIEHAVTQGAQIVVLPELVSTGYVFADIAEARQLAEPADGPTVTGWQRLADELDVVIVAGFCELGADDLVYNSAAVLVPGTVPVVHRKTHLWDRERLIFTPGDRVPPLVATSHGRIAPLICYELEFPELVRIPALAGADLICAPVNWPDLPRPAGERPGEVIRVQADASVNRVAIAVCDRAGTERGVAWTSSSVIVDADGWPLAIADGTEPSVTTLFADVDLLESRRKALAGLSDAFADRRPDLYGTA